MEARLTRLSLTSEAGNGEGRWRARTGRELGLLSRTLSQAENAAGQPSEALGARLQQAQEQGQGAACLLTWVGTAPASGRKTRPAPTSPSQSLQSKAVIPSGSVKAEGGRTLQGSGTWRSGLAGTQEGTVSETAPRGRGGSKRRRTGCGPLPGRPNLPRSSDTVVSNVDGKMHLGRSWR